MGQITWETVLGHLGGPQEVGNLLIECQDQIDELQRVGRALMKERDEARRLLDDARAHKPDGEPIGYIGTDGVIRRTPPSDWKPLPLRTPAPVPAQPAADVAAIAKAVRDIPSRVESLGGQRFAYVKLSEVIDTIYSVAGKQPAAVPEAVAKDALEDLADTVSKALGRAWSLGQTYFAQADSESYSQNKKSTETQSKFHALVDATRAAILSAADTEVMK